MSQDFGIEPVKRSRLSQQIVIQICRLIRQGQFQPGDRLPPERELAERLAVSRASLREALSALEIVGMVTSRHGGGTYIRDSFIDGVLSPLALVLEPTGDTVGELWEVRIMFEPAMAALAATRATAEQLEMLEEILQRQEREIEHADHDNSDWVDLDREFHITLARASQNMVAVRVVHLINELIHEGRRYFTTSHERRNHAYMRHCAIVEEVRKRNPAAAEQAMLRHLQEVEEFILGELVEFKTDTVTG